MDKKSRQQLGRQILTILTIHLSGKDLTKLRALDVGCHRGVISSVLAEYFGTVVGIDINTESIRYAIKHNKRSNLKFQVMDATKITFTDESFDLVVANQVIPCIENAESLATSVFRVLKPGGLCFVGSVNKYRFWPARGVYYHKSFWQMKRLFKKFVIYHYTSKILHDPKAFNFIKLRRFTPLLSLLPVSFWEKVEPILPNFIWILEKPTR